MKLMNDHFFREKSILGHFWPYLTYFFYQKGSFTRSLIGKHFHPKLDSKQTQRRFYSKNDWYESTFYLKHKWKKEIFCYSSFIACKGGEEWSKEEQKQNITWLKLCKTNEWMDTWTEGWKDRWMDRQTDWPNLLKLTDKVKNWKCKISH